MRENDVSNFGLPGNRRAFLAMSGGMVAGLAATSTTVRAKDNPQALQAEMVPWNAAPKIPLWPGAVPDGGFTPAPLPPDFPPFFMRNVEHPYLRVFRPRHPNGRAVLTIPGGAYTFVSIANEGVDVACEMTARGYTVFVLVYRLPGEGWHNRADVPLQDAQRAMRLIRSQSGHFGIDPRQVFAVGFSAGGHLCATLATGWDEPVYEAVDASDHLDARPDAVGLVYPVISLAPGIGHAESTLRLVGKDPPMRAVVRRSPADHVRHDMPAVFLVHAMDDTAVSVDNSLIMMSAVRASGVPVEAHLFGRGGHAFGTGRPGEPNATWPALFAHWLDGQSRLHS